MELDRFTNEQYCYLTTKGRLSGNPHQVEIWFGLEGTTLYLLSGAGASSDWVKNLKANPHITLRIAKQTFDGIAHLVSNRQEDATARRLLAAKYYKWREGQPLNDWAGHALPVAVDLQG